MFFTIFFHNSENEIFSHYRTLLIIQGCVVKFFMKIITKQKILMVLKSTRNVKCNLLTSIILPISEYNCIFKEFFLLKHGHFLLLITSYGEIHTLPSLHS